MLRELGGSFSGRHGDARQHRPLRQRQLMDDGQARARSSGLGTNPLGRIQPATGVCVRRCQCSGGQAEHEDQDRQRHCQYPVTSSSRLHHDLAHGAYQIQPASQTHREARGAQGDRPPLEFTTRLCESGASGTSIWPAPDPPRPSAPGLRGRPRRAGPGRPTRSRRPGPAPPDRRNVRNTHCSRLVSRAAPDRPASKLVDGSRYTCAQVKRITVHHLDEVRLKGRHRAKVSGH